MANKPKVAASEVEGDNTKIWNQICRTPSEYGKQFTRAGGFTGTSIDPVWRIRTLTELFGPCGKGWGFVQEDQWSDGGSGAYVVYVRGHLWYMEDGERYQTMSHTGGTVCDRSPDEAYKMAETDALGKCCLDLGMAADIYMGIHDGDKYQRNETGKQYSYDRENAGRRQAGSNPKTGSKSTEAPKVPIAEKDVEGITQAILDLTDDVAAYEFSRKLFERMVYSDQLSKESLQCLAERMATKRSGFITEAMLPSLKKTLAAYVKQGWMAKESADKYVSLSERRLGIAPAAK